MIPNDEGKVKSRYEQLAVLRQPFLDRARDNALLTLPYLMPPEGHTADASLPQPHQSVAATGINTLASKLVLSVFPSSSLFFRLDIDDNTEDELQAFAEEAGIDATNVAIEIRQNLAKTERVIQKWMEGSTLRVIMHSAMKHLINSGNYMVQADFSKTDPVVRGFRMDQYVVNLSPRGELMELIIREMVDPMTLDEDILNAVGVEVHAESMEDPRTEELFTYFKLDRKKKKYETKQEMNGRVIPKSEGTIKREVFPYLPLTWERETTEMYGRSYIEQLIGDLITADGLSAALKDGAAASAKVVFLNNPNGMTKTSTIAKAQNCDIVAGNVADVQALQVQKMNDFRVAQEQLMQIFQRLNLAFISQTAVQRDAERVTAEEIRMIAEMLDQQLGGVYARFGPELQTPLANLLIKGLEKGNRIQRIPDDDLKIQVITGIEALGRGQELQALRGAITDTAQLLGPEALQMMHVNELVSRIFHGYGAKPEGIVKTPQELEEERQAAQQAAEQEQAMQMAQAVAPQVIEQEGQQGPPVE